MKKEYLCEKCNSVFCKTTSHLCERPLGKCNGKMAIEKNEGFYKYKAVCQKCKYELMLGCGIDLYDELYSRQAVSIEDKSLEKGICAMCKNK